MFYPLNYGNADVHTEAWGLGRQAPMEWSA